MNEDWSKTEVFLIVDDYFVMLRQELQREKYNKTTHRRELLPKLNNRTDGSVEFKHQNISAVLAKMGQPFIRGYKPKFNYQQALEGQVAASLQRNMTQLEPLFERFEEEIVSPNTHYDIDFESALEGEPIKSEFEEEEPSYRTYHVNYLEKEQNNRILGVEGEQFVLDYEKWRLSKAGKKSLADKIEWTSKSSGDGAGYDILSKNVDGSDRFVEVKTTKLSKETPIYLTENEINFATMHSDDFYLYRVFNFDSKRKLFIKKGNYRNYCRLIPLSYRGIF